MKKQWNVNNSEITQNKQRKEYKLYINKKIFYDNKMCLKENKNVFKIIFIYFFCSIRLFTLIKIITFIIYYYKKKNHFFF